MSERRKSSRWIPIIYGVVALGLVAVLFPSALRPPPDEASASASFSPDAPPDEDPDVIIQSLQAARSATAGGLRVEDEAAPDAPATTTTTTAPPQIVQTLGGCFGNPPRQIEAAYAGPCVPVWQGDNGGATTKGVSGDEVRIIIWNSSADYDVGYTGRVPTEPEENESSKARTIRVLQQYFNQNFEFYGRRMQLIVAREPGGGTENRAHAVATDETYGGLFAGHSDDASTLIAGASRNIFGMGGFQLAYDVYEQNRPYLLGWQMDGTKLVRLNAEYLCKRLAGRPAKWAGDPDLRTRTRKFGLVYQTDSGPTDFDTLSAQTTQRCGIDISAYQVTYDDGSTSTALASFRLEGVTSVIVATDALLPALITNQADSQAYHPEWVVAGQGLVDDPGVPGILGYSRSQWINAFGISPRELRLLDEKSDWFRAYKSIDPIGEPEPNSAQYIFPILLQFANGLQGAGPKLTVEKFRQAIFDVPPRNPDPPNWLCCKFGPDDLTYGDMINDFYWVPDGVSPNCEFCQGSYIYPECGARWGEGQVPDSEPVYFEGGCREYGDGRSQGPSVR